MQNDDVIGETNDAKWKGSTIDLLMNYAAEYKWNVNLIKRNIMDNPEIIDEGKLEFLKLYKEYKNNCNHTKWKVLFNGNDAIIRSFII